MRLSVAKIMGIIFLSIMLCSACGSGGGGNGGDPTPTLQPDPTPDPGVINLQGEWNLNETFTAVDNTCDGTSGSSLEKITITQDGNDLTIVDTDDPDGDAIQATISGYTVTGNGSSSDPDYGTVDIELILTVSEDETSAEGSIEYIFQSCSVTTTAVITKPQPVINIQGKWHYDEDVVWSDCSDRDVGDTREYDVDITQNGTNIIIEDEFGTVIQATISGDTVTGTGSFTDSGCDVVVDLEIIVLDDEISAYGYATYTYCGCSYDTDIYNITKTS